jgi:hypothetical protein
MDVSGKGEIWRTGRKRDHFPNKRKNEKEIFDKVRWDIFAYLK